MPGTPRGPLRRWLEEPADPRDALTRGEKTNATELAAEIAAARTEPDYQAAAECFAEAFRSGDMGCEVLSVNVALEDVSFRVSHGSASRVVRVVLSEVTAPEPVARTHAMLAAVQVWAQLRTDVAEPEFRDHVTINPGRTRAALVPALTRFVENLPVLGIARHGPMSMEGWTATDHAIARMWAVGEQQGLRLPPPPKVLEYIELLHLSCDVEVSEDAYEPGSFKHIHAVCVRHGATHVQVREVQMTGGLQVLIGVDPAADLGGISATFDYALPARIAWTVKHDETLRPLTEPEREEARENLAALLRKHGIGPESNREVDALAAVQGIDPWWDDEESRSLLELKVTHRPEVHGSSNKVIPLTIEVPAGAIADAVDLPPVSRPEITHGVAAMMLGDALKREGLGRTLLARIDDSVQISASLGGASEVIMLPMFEAIGLADWVEVSTRGRPIWRLDDHRLRERCQALAREAKSRLMASGQVVSGPIAAKSAT